MYNWIDISYEKAWIITKGNFFSKMNSKKKFWNHLRKTTQSQTKNVIEQHFIFQCCLDFLHVLRWGIDALFRDVSEALIRKRATHDLFYARKLINQISQVLEGLPDNHEVYYLWMYKCYFLMYLYYSITHFNTL